MPNQEQDIALIAALDCCHGASLISPLSGGMTNRNFKVDFDGGGSDRAYVVRLGADVPEHLIMRASEHAASVASAKAGFSPDVIHHQAGVLVIRFIDGKVYEAADIAGQENLSRIVTLLKRFHIKMPDCYQGYPGMFWVFQVLRHYRNMLVNAGSAYVDEMTGLLQIAGELEQDLGPVDIVFAHNDLLPANFIDDGSRLWLIDFDYSGFNTPLFDLANLASNSELGDASERDILEQYFEEAVSESRWRSYWAIKCASLLRETVWSMVSEAYSALDVDYPAYTLENRTRFDQAWKAYQDRFR